MTAESDMVEALKRGESGAFEALFSRYGSMLYRVASRIVGQRDEVEDVLQESLLSVYEKIHTFNSKAALTTWLYRIVVNSALMRLRAKSRLAEESMIVDGPEFTEEGHLAREIGDWSLSPEETLLRREAVMVLRKGIDRLPDTYRAVYVLAEIERLSHQNIATILDVSVGNVKTRLHRARLFLREVLENYFVERRQGTNKA